MWQCYIRAIGKRFPFLVYYSSFHLINLKLLHEPPSARVVSRRAYDRIGVGGGTDDAAGSLSRP